MAQSAGGDGALHREADAVSLAAASGKHVYTRVLFQERVCAGTCDLAHMHVSLHVGHTGMWTYVHVLAHPC